MSLADPRRQPIAAVHAAVHAVSTPLVLAAIRFYKRHLSPHKGFACAYRVHVGACSCSTLGLRAVSRYGAWRGLGVLRLRLEQCRLAAAELRRAPRVVAPRGQGGFVDCDVPCDAPCPDLSCADGCSPGDVCSLSDACELASCLDCGDGLECNGCGASWRKPGEPRPALNRRLRRRGEPVRGDPAPEPSVEPAD